MSKSEPTKGRTNGFPLTTTLLAGGVPLLLFLAYYLGLIPESFCQSVDWFFKETLGLSRFDSTNPIFITLAIPTSLITLCFIYYMFCHKENKRKRRNSAL